MPPSTFHTLRDHQWWTRLHSPMCTLSCNRIYRLHTLSSHSQTRPATCMSLSHQWMLSSDSPADHTTQPPPSCTCQLARPLSGPQQSQLQKPHSLPLDCSRWHPWCSSWLLSLHGVIMHAELSREQTRDMLRFLFMCMISPLLGNELPRWIAAP